MTIYTQDDKPVGSASDSRRSDIVIMHNEYGQLFIGYYDFKINWWRNDEGLEFPDSYQFQWMYNPFINDKTK